MKDKNRAIDDSDLPAPRVMPAQGVFFTALMTLFSIQMH